MWWHDSRYWPGPPVEGEPYYEKITVDRVTHGTYMHKLHLTDYLSPGNPLFRREEKGYSVIGVINETEVVRFMDNAGRIDRIIYTVLISP